jgi:hypothetical protein
MRTDTLIRRNLCRGIILLSAISFAASVHAVERAPDLMQGDGRVSAFYSWNAAIPEPGKLLRQERLEPTLGLAKAGTQYRILYSSIDGIDGKSPNVVSGLLFVPPGDPPAGGWPLMAWGHETAGMADICAPSWVGYSPHVEAFLNAWLAHGMAVVATDYQGLGTTGPHPYMIVRPRRLRHPRQRTRGSKLLPDDRQESVARRLLARGRRCFRRGDASADLRAGLDIEGIITTGMSYTTPETVATMRKEAANQASYTLIYPLYIALVAQQFDPALKESDMFSDKALPLFEATRHACLGQLVIDVLSSGLTRNESLKPGYAAALDKIVPLLDYPTLKLSQPVFMGIGELNHRRPGYSSSWRRRPARPAPRSKRMPMPEPRMMPRWHPRFPPRFALPTG